MIVIAACMASFSLYILCSCARRTGTCSYSEVARVAFGKKAENFVTGVLATFLLFVTIAFMVLIRDINTSIVTPFLKVGDNPSPYLSTYVLLVSIICCLPFMMQKSLHALRYNCYVGFCSVLILLLTLVYKAILVNYIIPCANVEYYNNQLTIESPQDEEKYHTSSQPSLTPPVAPFQQFNDDALWYTTDIYSMLFTFPLIALAFLSQFNMLTVHSTLFDPTRPRVKTVINTSILTCMVMFLVFGSAGYCVSYGQTRDNILLNFAPDDEVISLGRAGLSVTLMCGISMIVLPCREALLQILAMGGLYKPTNTDLLGSNKPRFKANMNVSYNTDDEEYDESPSTVLPSHKNVDVETTSLLNKSKAAENESIVIDVDSVHPLLHISLTIFIAFLCFVSATFCPGVSTVWSICGSSLGFIIAYIIPSACYIKLRQWKKGFFNPRILGAWVMLIFSTFLMISCSYQAVHRLIQGSVPVVADLIKPGQYNDDDSVTPTVIE